MNEVEMMKMASEAAYEMGAAVAVKRAAERAMHIGRPDVAEYLLGCMTPHHRELLDCMREVSPQTDTGRGR